MQSTVLIALPFFTPFVFTPSAPSPVTLQLLHRKTLTECMQRFSKVGNTSCMRNVLKRVVLAQNGGTLYGIVFFRACVSAKISVISVDDSGVVIFGPPVQFQNFHKCMVWFMKSKIISHARGIFLKSKK